MIIAKINDYEINRQEYELELKKLQNENNLNNVNEEVRSKAVNNLIEGYLLLQLAKKEKLEVSEDEILNKEIDFKLQFATENEFYQTLKNQEINEDTFRERIKEKLMVKKYIDNFCCQKKDFPEERLKNIYDKNLEYFKTPEKRRVYHILINDENMEKASKKINSIHQDIQTPKDFKKFAEDCSHCPSHCQCGDLGYVEKGKMLKEFDEVLFSLEKEEISKPFNTKFGWHIILVDDIKSGRIAKFDEIKASLCSRLSRIESELNLLKKIKKMKKENEITIFEERL